MLYMEDTKFLIGSILVGVLGVICLWQWMLFGAMSCFVLSGVGIAAHFRARRKEKKRGAELAAEKEKNKEKTQP